jgi:hypothetical protein
MIRYRTTWAHNRQIVMLLGLFFFSCTAGKKEVSDLSDYFFQADEFPPDGLTYTYANQRDSLAPPEIWHYQKIAPGRMESINYAPDGRMIQQQYDRFVPNGVLTDSLILYSVDSSGETLRIPVKVISPNRFPFDAVDSTKVWLTHLDWFQPGDSLHIVLQRRRRFMGYTAWMDHGRAVPAIRFRTEDTFETESEGWTSSAWTGEEIYARHLGLVYYKRNISAEMTLEFNLVKVSNK